jgi:hypothetical protein
MNPGGSVHLSLSERGNEKGKGARLSPLLPI